MVRALSVGYRLDGALRGSARVSSLGHGPLRLLRPASRALDRGLQHRCLALAGAVILCRHPICENRECPPPTPESLRTMPSHNRGARGWGNATRALGHRNYRLFFGGQSISLIGTWMTRIATSWLVYRLTDSALLLGLVSFA